MSGIESSGKARARDPKTGRFVKQSISEELERITEEELTEKEKNTAIEKIKEDLDDNEETMKVYEATIEMLQRQLKIEEMKSGSVGAQYASQERTRKLLEEELTEQLDELRIFKRKNPILATGLDLDFKVGKPEEYDGTPEKLQAFISQCELVFATQTKKFADPRAKILYLFSYCTKGSALAWRETLSLDQAAFLKDLTEDATKNGKEVWDTFIDQMKKTFMSVTLKIESQSKIMKLRQGNRRVEEYNNEFKMLAHTAEVDKTAQLMFYKQGLKQPIKSKIYESGDIPTDLTTWMKRAIAIDIGWRESQLDRPPSTFPNQNRPRNRTMVTQTRPRLSDEEYEKRKKERLCFKCGKPGHMSKSCYVKNRTIKEEEIEEEGKEIEESSFQ